MDGWMVARVLRPEGKGFLLLDAHPAGCVRTVEEMIAEVPRPDGTGPGPAALVIGGLVPDGGTGPTRGRRRAAVRGAQRGLLRSGGPGPGAGPGGRFTGP